MLELLTSHDPKTGQTMSLRCLNTALPEDSSNANPFDIASTLELPDMLNKFYNRQVDRKKIASKVLSFK